MFFSRFLTTSNLTTNEDIKGAYSNKRTNSNFNPFSAGNGILNCNEVLCGPLNPSLIDARGYVTEDYLISACSSTPVNQTGSQSAVPVTGGAYPVQQQQAPPVLHAPSGGSQSAVAPDVSSSSGQQTSSGLTSSSSSSPSKRQKSAVANSSTLPDIRLVHT